jgi:ubiquinone biosynthesis accessory factor UbiJ
MQLAQTLIQGEKPPVHIEGDVQLAAEINWLVDHVRWDIEEDLSKLMGDVPAHTLMQGARAMADTLMKFVESPKPASESDGAAA